MGKTIQEQIESVIDTSKKSTIAIHTISGQNAVDDAVSILWNGLEQSERTLGGLPGNFEIINSTTDISPNIYANDKDNNQIVVVVSIPEVMTDREGKDWFIGTYPTNCQKYDKDADTLPINKMIESEKKVPREFIAGLLIMNEGKTSQLNDSSFVTGYVEKFVPNSRFIGTLPEEEKRDFFETIKPTLISEGLKSVDENAFTSASLAAYLGMSSYYDDQLSEYQQTRKSK